MLGPIQGQVTRPGTHGVDLSSRLRSGLRIDRLRQVRCYIRMRDDGVLYSRLQTRTTRRRRRDESRRAGMTKRGAAREREASPPFLLLRRTIDFAPRDEPSPASERARSRRCHEGEGKNYSLLDDAYPLRRDIRRRSSRCAVKRRTFATSTSRPNLL